MHMSDIYHNEVTLKAELSKRFLIMQANVIFLFPDLISNHAYSIFFLGAN